MTDAERQAEINKIFASKIIKNVEATSVNAWLFQFTDGTSQQLIAEQAIGTPYGTIPGIFMDQELAQKP